MRRTSCGQEINSLKEIGLALSIIPLQHHYVRRQVQLKADIIAEVAQAQMNNTQNPSRLTLP
jgi:hypothetical protein